MRFKRCMVIIAGSVRRDGCRDSAVAISFTDIYENNGGLMASRNPRTEPLTSRKWDGEREVNVSGDRYARTEWMVATTGMHGLRICVENPSCAANECDTHAQWTCPRITAHDNHYD